MAWKGQDRRSFFRGARPRRQIGEELNKLKA